MLLPEAFGTGAQIIGGASGTWLVTQVVKVLNTVDPNQDQTAKIRSLAGLLSAVAVILLGFVNKDLQPTDLQHLPAALGAFAATWGLSHLIHVSVKSFWKKPESPIDGTEPKI
jgi:DMSO/TMAO reductase YedYZ heme-binding membrane subunit